MLLGAAATAASKKGVEAAQAAEVPHEHIQRLGEVEVREPEVAPAGPPPQTGRAVAVIRGALLGIAQDFVRLGDLLELRFRRLLLIRAHAIGVMLKKSNPRTSCSPPM